MMHLQCTCTSRIWKSNHTMVAVNSIVISRRKLEFLDLWVYYSIPFELQKETSTQMCRLF